MSRQFCRQALALAAGILRKAVDRNRIKRLMREAYRLQKNELQVYLEQQNLRLSVFILYTGKDLPEYPVVF